MAASQGETPFVSIIIPVYNDSIRLRLCLRALDQQNYPREQYEIIVADNGSSEDIGAVVAQFPQARMVVERKPGSYAARNAALAVARGDVLAFTDSDCVPGADWLANGVARLLANPGAGLVAGKIQVFFRNPVRPTAVEVYESVTAFPQRKFVEKYRFGATANVFTRRDVFDRVGLFNDTLKSSGDREWGQRVHAAGLPLIYADDVMVAHPARASFGELYHKSARVIGGMRDVSGRGKRLPRVLKAVVKDIIPPFKDIRQAVTDRRLPGVRKLQYIGVLLALRYMQAWLRVRLLFGRPAWAR